jgi:ketosteroid isomerase-like protein
MSQENVEIGARTAELLAAWNQGDLEGLLAKVREDLIWRPATMSNVEAEDFHGRDGFSRFVKGWKEVWPTWDVEIQEIREVADRIVIVLGQVHARGGGSGIELDSPVAYVFEFRDDLLARGTSFFDHEDALSAAALMDSRS